MAQLTRPRRTPRSRSTTTSLLALGSAGALLLAVVGTAPATAHEKPGKPDKPRTVDLQILSFNDYHGHLAPPSGSDGTLPGVTGSSYGGSAYLATELQTLRAGKKNTLTVAAGDLIGASPIISGLFKDEPSIESLNALKLDVSSVGNHEFDEGVPELLRMQYGGCSPTDGCANVTYKQGVRPPRPANSHDYGSWFHRSTGRTILPPTWVTEVEGIKVGFIGMTLEGTPELVAQAGIKDVDFRDEVVTAGLAARDLRQRGVEAIVVPQVEPRRSRARSWRSRRTSTRASTSWSAVTRTSPTPARSPTPRATRARSPARCPTAASSPTPSSSSTAGPAT